MTKNIPPVPTLCFLACGTKRASSAKYERTRSVSFHFKAWKETLLVLSYFALLALFVPQAKKHNVGTGGMFFVMIGCGVLLAVVYYGIQLLRKWMQQRHISGREVRAYMSGSVAASLASQREDIGGSALVALDPRTLQETGTLSQP